MGTVLYFLIFTDPPDPLHGPRLRTYVHTRKFKVLFLMYNKKSKKNLYNYIHIEIIAVLGYGLAVTESIQSL
jgi:hypothetical protein